MNVAPILVKMVELVLTEYHHIPASVVVVTVGDNANTDVLDCEFMLIMDVTYQMKIHGLMIVTLISRLWHIVVLEIL